MLFSIISKRQNIDCLNNKFKGTIPLNPIFFTEMADVTMVNTLDHSKCIHFYVRTFLGHLNLK